MQLLAVVLVLEPALAALFQWRVYRMAFNARALKTPIMFVVGLLIVMVAQYNPMDQILSAVAGAATGDVAVLRISPPAPAAITPLRLGEDMPEPSAHGELEALYTVGHPGLISVGLLDAKARAVFGNPDGTKRLSPGRQMPGSATLTLHDCSTIGGFSGAPLLSFRTHEVAGLRCYGDPAEGNRAIEASELRR